MVIYSNRYTLIGYLVQKFSGVPYKKYIQDNIFTPLEMTNTAFEPTPAMDERISMPYTVDEKTGSQVPTVRVKAAVWPAGIVYGTIHDQANWMIANLNGGVFKGKRMISEETLDQMFTRQHDRFKGSIEGIWGNDTAGFGLTWWSQVRDGDRYFAHSGSLGGYTAFLLGNRDRKLGFAILTNGKRAHAHLFKLADRAMDDEKHSETARAAAGIDRVLISGLQNEIDDEYVRLILTATLICIAALTLLSVSTAAQAADPIYDIVIRNGRVLDGAGIPGSSLMWPLRTDVLFASAMSRAKAGAR